MIENVLALGAGTMGSQASFYYVMHGRDVFQYDVSEEALAVNGISSHGALGRGGSGGI